MKNKILIFIIILCQIIFANKLFAKEIDFQAKEIEILNDQNLTIAKNGTAIIKDDGVIIKGEILEYFKDKSLLIINKGKISTIDKNFEINSNLIEYKIDESNIDFKGKVYLKDNINIRTPVNNQKAPSNFPEFSPG